MDLRLVPEYRLIKEEYIEEICSEGYLLEHIKTKARVFVLENNDNNKVFNIAFRTVPKDSTGVAHIIEHTVLCGSDRYPVKDPFVELAKGSLNTFLNAMTYPDKTMYPLASTNDKDFRNLMSVYLDAVFRPAILKDRRIFEQEGWHYELEDENSPLVYNGVVYNEMKGAFSDPDDAVERCMQTVLYPDTTYAFESGGDPDHIPDLTYEAYIEFYKKYYHPSNSYIYLYGNADMISILKWMDEEYLGHYDYLKVASEINLQEPFKEMKEAHCMYSASEGSDSKSYLSWSKVVSTMLDKKLYLAMQVLEYVLITSSAAPIKQALLDKGIGDDIYGGYNDGILQPSFSITAKNADAGQRKEFEETILSVLKGLVKDGINKKTILAGINSLDFHLREGDYGRFPKGLMIGLECFGSWLYDKDDPFMHLETMSTMNELRHDAEGRYFEELIQKWLIDNQFGAVVIADADEKLDENKEAETTARLADYKNSLTADEIKAIALHTKQLKQYQEEPSSKESLETIPMLDVKDIRKEIQPLYNDLRQVSDIDVLFHEMFSSGIAYAEFVFDADFTDYEDLVYISMFKYYLTAVSTKSHSYNELIDEINIHTGGISTGFVITNKGTESPSVKYSLKVKMLYSEIKPAMQLMREIMYETCFDDDKRLYEILGEVRSQLEATLTKYGNSTAVKRAASYFSKPGRISETMSGVDFYEFINDIYKNFDEKKESFKNKLTDIYRKLINKNSLLISLTCDEEGFKLMEPEIEAMSKTMSAYNKERKAWDIKLEKKNEGFACASQIQFVARAGSFEKMPYRGSLNILRNIMDYDYMWIRIRVKGGAYGCMSGFGRDKVGYFVSYLDPKLRETNEIYEKIPEYLEKFNPDKRSMDRYIIGTISEMDIPKNPAALGQRGLAAYTEGISEEELQKQRDEVLGAGAEDIRALAPYVRAILDEGCICVVGNSSRIQEASDMFKEIKHL